MTTGTLDLFFDESLDYARRLCQSGVPVELHAYAGGFHGFNFFSVTQIAKAFANDLDAGIARLLRTA